MIKNVFLISEKILKKINADWDNGKLYGHALFNKDNDCFIVPAELAFLSNDFLQQTLKKLNDENRLTSEEKDYSNVLIYPHLIHVLYDEDDSRYPGRILLKPSCYIDTQLLSFMTANQMVVNKCKFSSNSDIELLLSRLYGFCIQKDIVMVARYIKNNVFFKLLKKSRGGLKICTIDPNTVNQSEVRQAIGNRSFTLKKGKKVDNHQRMVKMKSIIIVCDNDFDQLTTAAATWTLNASIDDQILANAEHDIACFK